MVPVALHGASSSTASAGSSGRKTAASAATVRAVQQLVAEVSIPLVLDADGLNAIAGDLAELCQGRRAGRSFYNQITLFKSVGTALEDLAAAEYIFDRTRR